MKSAQHQWEHGQCLVCSCTIEAFVSRLRGGQIYLCNGMGFSPYDIRDRGDHDMELSTFGAVNRVSGPMKTMGLYNHPVELCRKCGQWTGRFDFKHGNDDCAKKIIRDVLNS